jgi:hypothetical protein
MLKTLVCKHKISDRGTICYGKLFTITMDLKAICNKCGNEIDLNEVVSEYRFEKDLKRFK